jgi:hypothetical protein
VIDTVPGMPRYRILRLVAAVALLGACGSAPQPASKIATLTSGAPTTAASGSAASGGPAGPEQGTRWRLDSTDEEQIQLVEQYQECLFQHGVKEKPRDKNAMTVAGKAKHNLDESGEPKAAYAACAPKKPLPPVELDPNANPNFAAQWADNVRCLRAHGLNVHTTEPGSWTYDTADTKVPDNEPQLEHDCLLEVFGGKKK